MNVSVSPSASAYWRSRATIDGAFWDVDFRLFDELLTAQDALGVKGDLLEIGALYGKSTIVLGVHAESDETVHVCDVFESEASTDANQAENESSYPGLARDTFEANYRKYVDRDPRIIQEWSTAIASHIEPGTLRFAHVDGGHLFETVVDDLRNVKPLMGERGVIVLDDFRALHTPGVAAAAWAEVVSGGLVPFAISEQKMYATWGPAGDYARHLDTWLARSPDVVSYGYQDVAGHTLLVIENPTQPTTFRARVGRWVPPAIVPLLLGKRPGPHLGTRERQREIGA
ncbi:class I SAM-dependent methyltransferase [Aeromicrobium alkaliterrae]|uniref:Class I SAM-dependent methyltransferase n=1 Tax=Aeromicrobium alkaliterrae TaxID=302168 RepID=A0ABN2JDC2_9ACTN